MGIGALGVGTGTCLGSDVVLTWSDRSSNEAGFSIERSIGGLLWLPLDTVPANTTRYVDRAILGGVLHSYRVRAYNDSGYSSYSNVATATGDAPAHVNEPPEIAAIPNQSTIAGSSTGRIYFAISDAETPASALSVTMTSSNSALVRENSWILGGSGDWRWLEVTPPPDQAGTTTITVRVSDGELEAVSRFELVVARAATGPTFSENPAGGTVAAGDSILLRASAAGEGPVVYQWYLNGVAIPGATNAEYEVFSAQRFDAGEYRVRAVAGGRGTWSEAAVVAVPEPPSGSSRLINVSTRSRCHAGDRMVIPGWVIGGSGTCELLVRAVGPTLGREPFSLPGVLANPRLRVQQLDAGAYEEIAVNSDWGRSSVLADLVAATAKVGAFPLVSGARDAAVLVDVSPGQYTAMVDDESGREGIVLMEVYDTASTTESAAASLRNVSNRGLVGPGDGVMIVGFVIAGDGPLTVLVRAVGPGLAAAPFGLTGVLSDPQVEVFGSRVDGSSALVAANDDWNDHRDAAFTAAEAARVSAFPLQSNSRDSAVVLTLKPGAYTALVRGHDAAPGVALAELYVAP